MLFTGVGRQTAGVLAAADGLVPEDDYCVYTRESNTYHICMNDFAVTRVVHILIPLVLVGPPRIQPYYFTSTSLYSPFRALNEVNMALKALFVKNNYLCLGLGIGQYSVLNAHTHCGKNGNPSNPLQVPLGCPQNSSNPSFF